MIQIIDDVICKTYQDRLEETFLSQGLCWSFSENLTSQNTGEIGFGHNLIAENYRSEFFNFTLPLIYETSEKTGVNLYSVLTGRSFLQLPSIKPYNNDIFHVDLDVNHMVFLYYVNDSDGDTLISEEKYDPNIGMYMKKDSTPKILERVKPKKGRIVVFDGTQYHAAGIPKENKRCILNFDIAERPVDLY